MIVPEAFVPNPAMIAAAWGVLRDRWPGQPHLLGPGPGFVEAIVAALAVMPRTWVETEVARMRAGEAGTGGGGGRG